MISVELTKTSLLVLPLVVITPFIFEILFENFGFGSSVKGKENTIYKIIKRVTISIPIIIFFISILTDILP